MWSLYDHGKLATIRLRSVDTRFCVTLEGNTIFIHLRGHSVALLRLCSVPGSGDAEEQNPDLDFEDFSR